MNNTKHDNKDGPIWTRSAPRTWWMLQQRAIGGGVFLLLALLFAGCSSKVERAAKHVERANGYFAAGKFEEAEIEYKNALRLSPTNGAAISGLGIVFHDQGKLLPAISFLVKAKEVMPDNLEARNKLGWALNAGHKIKEARDEALFILSKQPTHEEALILLGDTVQNSNDLAEVTAHLERLRPQAENQAGYQVAWSSLYYRQGQVAEAEAALKKALQLDPKSSAVHATLGNFYLAQENVAEAERFFKVAADLAPPRSGRRLRYAEFKLRNNDLAGAKEMLTQMTEETPDYLPAWSRLAELAFAATNYADCEKFLKQILDQDPLNFDAALLRGRLLFAQNKIDEGAALFEKLNKTFPDAPPVLYQLALAQLIKKDRTAAMNSLNQAVAKNPSYTEAAVLLANLNIQNQDYNAAIAVLKNLLRSRPRLSRAQLLLAATYRAQGNLDEAMKGYDQMIQLYPKAAEPVYLKGTVLQQQKKTADAQKAFQAALALDPKYLPAVERLVDFELADKQYPAALQRVQKQLEIDPQNALVHLLLAKVQLVQRNFDQAEAAVNRAIELAPNYQASYNLLVQIYIATKKHQQALDKLQAMLAKNPKNTGALLQVGMIYDALKKYSEARDTYEKLLQLAPDATAALNNLAYLYAEHFNNLDRAYELALKAHDRRTENPTPAVIDDTLGWVLFKRGEFTRALPLLKDSAAELPNQPEVLYHLGMTQYMLGDDLAARDAFERALKTEGDFPGRTDIQGRMSMLSIDPKTAGPEALATLEKARQADPGDLLVLSLLAKIYEKDGAADKEMEICKAILSKNPRHLTALKRMAWLYSAQPGQTETALNLAKQARDLDNSDPRVAHLLGRLAFRTGDSAWSLSLLQESARKLPDQPDVLQDLAWSLFSAGRLTEAQTALQTVVKKVPDPAKTGEARQFLTMIELGLSPQKAGPAMPEIQKILNTNPNYVPALFVAGQLQEIAGQYPQAREVYAHILGLKGYESFTPAHRALALLLVGKLNEFDKAYNHAVKAREAYPQDGPVAKALGIVSYKRNDNARAVQLFTECTRSLASDADVFYYLGLAQFKLNRTAECQKNLTQALALDANSPLAGEAKGILAQLEKK